MYVNTRDIFILVGYFVFFAAKGCFLKSIFKESNCNGASGKTQILYVIVFVTRSTSNILNGSEVLWRMHPTEAVLNSVFLFVSLFLLWSIFIKFSDSYQREDDICRIEPLLLALGVFSMRNGLWDFSKIVESVAILPQLFLSVRQKRIEPQVRLYVSLLALSQLIHLFVVYDSMYLKSSMIQFVLYLKFFERYMPTVSMWGLLWRLGHNDHLKNEDQVISTLESVYSKEKEAADNARLQHQHQNFQDVNPPPYEAAVIHQSILIEPKPV
ncbi:hypothetical protein QAD02_018902 [Eretmocerus hayati]|uniref:Uncharacterized protein n=1 Tax=Eretmocerus hayati TaxID=131215 RepID=A0ACC2PHP0_9HYME|nr:hypothetical protein QAD02_018902 [Eretmocerus hayati]